MVDETRFLGFGGEHDVRACVAAAERKAEIFVRKHGEISAALARSQNPQTHGELKSRLAERERELYKPFAEFVCFCSDILSRKGCPRDSLLDETLAKFGLPLRQVEGLAQGFRLAIENHLRAHIAAKTSPRPPDQDEVMQEHAHHDLEGRAHSARPTPSQGSSCEVPAGNRAEIDAFISRVSRSKEGQEFIQNRRRKITRRDIWRVAGYTHPTEFERYQRDDPKSTHTAKRKFKAVLKMESGDFIKKLRELPPAE